MVAARARRRLKIDTQRCLEVSGEGDCVASFFGTQSTPLTAQISLLPYANEKVAAKVLEHAQGLKESDPKEAVKKRAKKTLCLKSEVKCYLTQIG